jgi:hypothetical protein
MSTYAKEFPYFSAETLEQTQEGWRHIIVGVFQHDQDDKKTLLGKFERNSFITQMVVRYGCLMESSTRFV